MYIINILSCPIAYCLKRKIKFGVRFLLFILVYSLFSWQASECCWAEIKAVDICPGIGWGNKKRERERGYLSGISCGCQKFHDVRWKPLNSYFSLSAAGLFFISSFLLDDRFFFKLKLHDISTANDVESGDLSSGATLLYASAMLTWSQRITVVRA